MAFFPFLERESVKYVLYVVSLRTEEIEFPSRVRIVGSVRASAGARTCSPPICSHAFGKCIYGSRFKAGSLSFKCRTRELRPNWFIQIVDDAQWKMAERRDRIRPAPISASVCLRESVHLKVAAYFWAKSPDFSRGNPPSSVNGITEELCSTTKYIRIGV